MAVEVRRDQRGTHQAYRRCGQTGSRDDRQKNQKRPPPIPELLKQDECQQELLGEQERQDSRDPQRGEQLCQDDAPGVSKVVNSRASVCRSRSWVMQPEENTGPTKRLNVSTYAT